MIKNNIIPTYLFCGESEQTEKTIVKLIKSIFCKNKESDNCFCSECKKIKSNQHSNVIFIEPEKHYLLKDLTIIFEKIKFQLEPDELFFFILKKADLLTVSCANKMLKVLEEPPEGYKFLLLTDNENEIIPTIKSRCYITYVKSKTNSLILDPLLTFFLDKTKFDKPTEFEQIIKKRNLSESESSRLINQIINFLQKQNNKKELLLFFKKQFLTPPQPGSTTLFWKNLFLNFPRSH